MYFAIDSKWGVWSGGIGGDGVAMLAAVVTGGYHANTIYQWMKGENKLTDEKYPIIFVRSSGSFFCVIDVKKNDSVPVSIKLDFTVKQGKSSLLLFPDVGIYYIIRR